MKRTATAAWSGDGLTGTGMISTQSGTFDQQPYSFKTRFESQDGRAGTNPEELIAAAHAGCFSMALSFILAGAGHEPEELLTTAEVEIEKKGEGFEITAIALKLQAKIANIDPTKFQELAQTAKATCPVSKALSAVPNSLTAELFQTPG